MPSEGERGMEEKERQVASPSFKETLLSFLSPLRCRACRTVLTTRAVLCERCAREYYATLAWECGLCGLPPAHCTCTGEYLTRARIRRHIQQIAYQYPRQRHYSGKGEKCHMQGIIPA